VDEITADVVVRGTTTTVRFVPAPADERPAGEVGGCSHFVAKTPFLRADDVAVVRTITLLNGQAAAVAWSDFCPDRFAHHRE
jgi:hypothetical protein